MASATVKPTASSQPAVPPAASTLALRLALAGAANCCAATATNPLDVVKVRLQLQGELSASGSKEYSGWLSGMARIVAAEGPRGLYRGLAPSLLRESTYSAMRLGLYEPFRHTFSEALGGTTLLVRFLAGACSGMLGSAIATPTDLIKVRLQAARGPVGAGPGLLATAAGIVAKEGGVVALWQGVGPNVQRAALLTATQVGSYDQIKGQLKATGAATGLPWLAAEGLPLHAACAFAAGLVAALATTPVDVAKTRLMSQGQARKYSSTLDCLLKTAAAEGPLAVYKGFWPTWMRLGPHTIITFTVFEYLRALTGLPPV